MTHLQHLHVLKALEEGDQEEAFNITKKHVDQLVHTKDVCEGNVEGKEYKYRPFLRKGLTLLHYAAMYDNEEMVKILLENGAG